MTTLPPLAKMAELLGGDVRGDEVLCPGPRHSAADRSLAVKPDKDDDEGFVINSFAGDGWKDCRAHVRKKLGLPERELKKNGRGKSWTVISEHVYDDERGERFLKVRKCLDDNGKRQYPQYRWDGSAWVKGKPKGPKIPYRLPQLCAAPLTATVYFVEGEKDADALNKLGFVATTASEGAAAKWDTALTPHFKDRHVVVLPDADVPGRAHARKVAEAINGVAASVRVLDLYPDRNDGSDVSDWIADDTAGAKLAKLAKEAPLWEPDAEKPAAIADDEKLIVELAALSRLKYAKRRKDAAEAIGIGVGELDKIVADTRGDGKDKEPAPALYEHWNVEAASEPVDGAILLRALKEAIQRYVFMSEEYAVAVTLWNIFSWLHEHVTHSPILYVTSAEKDSGKSTLLGVLNFLARRPLQSVDISGPALFRSIEKWQPTLIVDEADDALADNPDLRSVINSGWTRGQGVIRCHPDTHEPELFSTFAPKIVAMKGRNLPDTTLSRSIIITLKPRRASDPKEHAADFNHCDNETFVRLRLQLLRWADDNAEALARATPEIPPGFHNRRRANWVPLLAIAEAGGADWKTAGWKAARAIEAIADTFDPSIGVELLRAIKGVFEAREQVKDNKNKDRITSAGLIGDLVEDKTAPWATYNKGKEISQRQVAGLLKPYGIKPKTIRWDDGTKDGSYPKGYLLEWFTDLFERFCTSSSPQNQNSGFHTSTDLFSHENSVSTRGPAAPHVEARKAFDNNDVEVWKPKSGVEAEKRGSESKKTPAPTAKRKSDDLPYDGPVVAVPDLGPDPFDEHGVPVAAQPNPIKPDQRGHASRPSNGARPVPQGVSERHIRQLGDQYNDRAYANYQESGDTRTAECDAWLRQKLADEGVLPEHIETEFKRVMAVVFGGLR
jgi:5S rRNA maturation endonuclease (ribonuclease M5)